MKEAKVFVNKNLANNEKEIQKLIREKEETESVWLVEPKDLQTR